jgi:hypothetical protein
MTLRAQVTKVVLVSVGVHVGLDLETRRGADNVPETRYPGTSLHVVIRVREIE